MSRTMTDRVVAHVRDHGPLSELAVRDALKISKTSARRALRNGVARGELVASAKNAAYVADTIYQEAAYPNLAGSPERCATRGFAAVRAGSDCAHLTTRDDADLLRADLMTDVADTLANIRHMCDRFDLPYDRLADDANAHYTAEVEETGRATAMPIRSVQS